MDPNTALDQLAQAKASANAQMASDLQDTLSTYVIAAEANAQASRAWFRDLANDDLASAAAQAWTQMSQARQALNQALSSARGKRTQALADTWAAVKAG